MLYRVKHLAGFSLIEISLVLIILATVFSSIILPQQEKIKHFKIQQTHQQLKHLENILIQYFLSNSRFPCPATVLSQGKESLSNDNKSCSEINGFFPSRTLEIHGRLNEDLLLIDTWNNPIRYSISNYDENKNKSWDWITPSDLKSITPLSNIIGNLKVCDTADCSGLTLTDKAVIVLFSQGSKNHQSDLETQNTGEKFEQGLVKKYGVSNNRTFSYLSFQQNKIKHEFDDIFLWIAPLQTYKYIIEY